MRQSIIILSSLFIVTQQTIRIIWIVNIGLLTFAKQSTTEKSTRIEYSNVLAIAALNRHSNCQPKNFAMAHHP